MGLPPKLLGTDEYEVLHTRTHAKAMVLPAAALVLVGAGVGAGAALVPGEWRPAGQLGIALLGLLLALWWTVLPLLRWRTTTYTLTNRRLVTRSGIVSKTSKDLPLSRVNDVSSQRSLSDRLLGCGTLNVQTASEAGVIALVDVPEVEHVHQTMTQLLFGADDESRPAHA
ncbi:PH domain-containing protein [Friedmanniella luteola]|uniref:PH domain-containing protein n=1 Tax=Friedmanniella luteola TaxID=546871 RepID=A0A1H1YJ99_9ACTN|nr:PH domain-containing protein [Friedmanniella luteola]SDT21492.1 PH domain-containing protein [Friedmanniella luteola]